MKPILAQWEVDEQVYCLTQDSEGYEIHVLDGEDSIGDEYWNLAYRLVSTEKPQADEGTDKKNLTVEGCPHGANCPHDDPMYKARYKMLEALKSSCGELEACEERYDHQNTVLDQIRAAIDAAEGRA